MNKNLHISTASEKIVPLTWYQQLLRYPRLFIVFSFSQLVWALFKKGLVLTAHPFFGGKMKVRLPAAKDIFIMGHKGTPPEIKLNRWMANHIKHGWTVLDIGAHYGFNTLLLHNLVGTNGHVIAFEPSPSSYSILKLNTIDKSNVHSFLLGMSQQTGKQLLAQNGIEKSKNNSFYFLAKTHTILVPTTTIDTWCKENACMPRFIGIDVEGWEWNVLKGAEMVLQQHPILAVSIATKHFEKLYYPLIEWLLANGYWMYSLSADGELLRCPDAWTELQNKRMHKDNFIFRAKRK